MITRISLFVLVLFSVAAQAKPDVRESRASLVSMGIRGIYEDTRSFWDVGVRQTIDGEQVECEFLRPRANTKAAKQPWAPFDFYTNITQAEKDSGADKEYIVGEPDIFFTGDDRNRNDAKETHKSTRQVTEQFRGSLGFERTENTKDSFAFVLNFQRGKVTFKGLVRARTWAEDGECRTSVFRCVDTYEDKGVLKCTPTGWKRKLLEVIAKADLVQAGLDGFRGITEEKHKNDVAAIIAKNQKLDENGEPVGSAEEETLAEK